MQRLFAEFGRSRAEVVVVEEVDLALQVVFLLIESHDFEAPLAASQDIHAAIGILLDYLFHQHRTACVHDAVVFCKHYAKLRAVLDGGAHHLFVAIFENVQRQMSSGEDHDLQREQGDEPRRHGTIMAQWDWPSARVVSALH